MNERQETSSSDWERTFSSMIQRQHRVEVEPYRVRGRAEDGYEPDTEYRWHCGGCGGAAESGFVTSDDAREAGKRYHDRLDFS